jgi:hypothetical protein
MVSLTTGSTNGRSYGEKNTMESSVRKPWHLRTLKEKRQGSVDFFKNDGVTRYIYFGCDECGAARHCEFAYDPYNIDGDCLAEK